MAEYRNRGYTGVYEMGIGRRAIGEAAGTVSPSINTTHSGGGFPNGPLTSDQISALAAYVNG